MFARKWLFASLADSAASLATCIVVCASISAVMSVSIAMKFVTSPAASRIGWISMSSQ